MAGIDNYRAFTLAAIVFSMTPGMDTFFVLNRSVAQGRRSGFFPTLGSSAGVLVPTFVAAVGLSALIAQSVLAFTIIKYLGAAYLVYIGLSKLLQRTSGGSTFEVHAAMPSSTAWQDVGSGVLTNVLNPKVGLFLIAFFPQFIRREMLDRSLSSLKSPLSFLAQGGIYGFRPCGYIPQNTGLPSEAKVKTISTFFEYGTRKRAPLVFS